MTAIAPALNGAADPEADFGRSGIALPRFPGGWLQTDSSAAFDCVRRAAVVIEPVSANSLCETGVFRETAGDFPLFRPGDWKTENLETKPNAGKPRFQGL